MSRIFSFALCAGAAFAWFCAPAFAADDSIIIAGRFPAKQTASSVSVITADEISRKQISTVFDALRTTPGVTGAQNGGPGQLGTIRLRGASSGQTLTLIDGVPVNDVTSTSGYNYSFLDSGVVERIEVLRGAGSAIWGSDAIGGVVNIITYEPGRDSFRAYGEGGSFNTGRFGARAARTFGPLTLSGYGTVFKTNGISAADEKDGNTEKDGSDFTTLSARAALALGGGWTASLGGRTTQGHADFDDGFGFLTGIADSNALFHSRESLGDAHLSWRATSGKYGVDSSVSRSLTKTLSEGSFGPFATRAERTQERITADTAIGATQTILAGAEHSDLKSATTFAPAAKSDTSAGFATYSGKFFDKLLLEGGARYEDDSRFGGITTGRIGAAYDVWQGGVIRATLGNAFRAPSINESTGGGFKLPNPNLKPEKSREWEIGFDQTLFDGKEKLGIVYFDQDTKNLITAASTLSYINLPRTDSKGVEVSANAELGRFDLEAVYTYDRARDRSTNQQLDHVAKHQASFDATWHATDKFDLGGKVIWNGTENDSNFASFPATPVKVSSWATLGLRASYKVRDNVEIYGRIDNVTDKKYEDIFSYGTEGRAAYIGIRVKQ